MCGTGETLLWYDSFSGGNQIGAGSPFMPAGYSNLSAGTYTYYAECSVGGCISAEGAPAPTVPDVAVCEGEVITICASIFTDAGVTMGMVFPPNSNSAGSALTPDAAGCVMINAGDPGYVGGTYTAQYVDANGCISALGSGQITINPLPLEPVIETACVCDGEDVGFTITNPLAGGSYSWTGPNGYTSNNPNPTISGLTETDNGTTYDVIVTDPNGCTAMGQRLMRFAAVA